MQPPWAAAVWQRLRWRFPLKFIGVCVFMWGFFVLYFQLLRHPVRPPRTMPMTAFDAWLPFEANAVWVYASLWVYIGVAPGMLRTMRTLLAYGAWNAALCASGLACFWLWPTAVPVRPVDASRLGVAMLQGVDASGNACPSLHVATAVFAALWIDALLRLTGTPALLRWANAAWLAAIVWSTLALRQHVALDALAGAALGAVFGAASLRLLRSGR